MVIKKDIIKFHHYGVATNSFIQPIKFHKNLGYKCTDTTRDNKQLVDLVFCVSEFMPSVELVKPFDERSPINGYINKNQSIIYHACYETSLQKDNIEEIFEGMNYINVVEPVPAILFNNRLVAFYYVKDLGLIEILDNQT
tara:strand:+ start:1855 stop:2274 length:420 start_codon:yes stop_codon:yes gene_type:complete